MRANVRRFWRRFPLMAASLLLAFLLWMLVIAEEQIEAGFMVPLVFEEIPATVVIDGPPTASVYVQIRGSKEAVESILPQQVRAHVDLSQSKPGDEFVQITPQSIVLPQGITVLGIYPPYLDLKFLARKPVPVRVRTVGKPAEGYEVKEVKAIPFKTEVVGPLRRVESIRRVDIRPIDISGLKRTLKVRAEVIDPGDDLRLLQLKPTEVVVEVAAIQVEKAFRQVPVKAGRENVETSPAVVKVVLRGDHSQVMGMAADKIGASVDWENEGSNPDSRPLKVEVPQGTELISFSPREVTIK